MCDRGLPDAFFPSVYAKAPRDLGGRDSQVCPRGSAVGGTDRIPSRPCREGSRGPGGRIHLGPHQMEVFHNKILILLDKKQVPKSRVGD